MLERFIFPRRAARVRQSLQGVIGPDAARAGGEYSGLRVATSCFALLTIGFAVWAEAIGGVLPVVLAVASGACLLYAAIAAVMASRRLGRQAQTYVAEHYGVDLRGTGAGAFRVGWERAIDRARRKGWLVQGPTREGDGTPG